MNLPLDDFDNDQPVEENDTGLMPRRRSREDAEMDITPMIDITFLLLIFFLVAAKMDSATDVSLPPARHGTSVATQSAIIITVAKGPGDSAVIYKGDGTNDDFLLHTVDPVDQENEIAEFVRKGFDTVPPRDSVVIKAEKGVKHREVTRVTQAVGSVEEVHSRNIELHLAVLEVQ